MCAALKKVVTETELPQCKIAFLEDDHDTRVAYKDCLNGERFDAQVFAETESFINYVLNSQLDLLVCDVQMDYQECGLATLGTLFDMLADRLPPIIIATGLRRSQISDHPVISRLSKWRYLAKPFNIDELLYAIQHSLHQQ